jgi:hypothetical protein
MHPSQSIPSTANVTVADCGELRQAFAQRATVNINWRLVIGVCSRPQSHHENTRDGQRVAETDSAPNEGCGRLDRTYSSNILNTQ